MFGNLAIYSIFAIRLTGCSVARSSRLLWEQEVAGSNPATPTKINYIGILMTCHCVPIILPFFYSGCGAAW